MIAESRIRITSDIPFNAVIALDSRITTIIQVKDILDSELYQKIEDEIKVHRNTAIQSVIQGNEHEQVRKTLNYTADILTKIQALIKKVEKKK